MAMMGLQDLMKLEYLCYLIQKCIKCEASVLLLSLCYSQISLWDRFSTIIILVLVLLWGIAWLRINLSKACFRECRLPFFQFSSHPSLALSNLSRQWQFLTYSHHQYCLQSHSLHTRFTNKSTYLTANNQWNPFPCQFQNQFGDGSNNIQRYP